MTGLWSSLLFISGNGINWERWTGTLEMLVGGPTPLPVVVFGKNLAHVSQSLVSMVAAYILMALIFSLELTLTDPLMFIIALAFTIVAFVCFGLIIAPVFLMNPGIQGWQNSMEFPIYILAGFLFPIALLPAWTTPISYLLAPYWAARALPRRLTCRWARSRGNWTSCSTIHSGSWYGCRVIHIRQFSGTCCTR